MAAKNAAPPKKDNSGAIIAGLAVAGGVAAAALLLTQGTKAAPPGPTGPTLKLTPNSGEITNIIVVTGKGWSANETISSLTIGGVNAAYTLVVDDTGTLNGTLTVPGLSNGAWNVIITGSVTGAITFPGAFTVKPSGNGAGWLYLAGTPVAITAATAYPVGWIPLNLNTPFIVAITASTPYPVGWIPLNQNTPFMVTITATTPYPTGWIPLNPNNPFTVAVTAVTPYPVGWIPLNQTNPFRVAVSPYTGNLPAQLNVSPTNLKTGDTLSFTFYNFTPMATVNVSVIGGGGLSVTANALGSGTGSFAIGEPAGTYTLQASDPYGKSATANFVVQASSGPTFPAPGTPGDGNYWYWVEWQGGAYGWDDYMDAIIQHDPLVLQVISGPYPSGATS